MKTIYNVTIADDEVGEVEGMFDDKGKLLGAWAMNDAYWRQEYFGGFMEELGFKVEDSEDPKLVKKLRKVFQ